MQLAIHHLPDIATWNEYLTYIVGLFCEYYILDLEDTIKDIHILFDVTSYGVALSSSNVMRASLVPLVPSLHHHLSQFGIGVENLKQYLEGIMPRTDTLRTRLDITTFSF